MPKRPNFLVILADDLGYSDIGAYGSEIPTPNLDKLAAHGLRQTGFHTASACSPTRSMLMSGTDNHLAGLGQMAETMMGDPLYQGRPGYEGMLNQRVAALPEILSDAGYETMMAGKWHLGMPLHAQPHARGFQKVFSLLPGAGNHYNTPAMKFMPPLYCDGPTQMTHKDIEGLFYSTTYFTDRLLGYLEERDESKPFFAYLPYTAPHWPLQAPDDEIAKYKGWYDDGPDALRLRRLERLKELGLLDKNINAHPMVNVFDSLKWDDLSEKERQDSSKKMEVYAAMVSCMETEIGRIVSHLEATGELDNTFILFASDNGAEGTLLEAIPVMGAALKSTIDRCYDNSLGNIGRGNSWTYLGPQWAQATTAPYKMYKAWTTEGGIRCPCIIRYPNLPIATSNAISHEFTTVMDILATILDLAGIAHPGKVFRGRNVLEPRGKSWVDWPSGKQDFVHDENAIHGWECAHRLCVSLLPSSRSMTDDSSVWASSHSSRQVEAVWLPPPTGNDQWLLYDIDADPGETIDLAFQEPAKLQEMVEYWHRYEAETGTVLASRDQITPGFGKSTGVKWDDWGA